MMIQKKGIDKKSIICMVLIIFIILVCVCFFASHKTYYRYNDWWIVGRTYSEVEKRYGAFDVEYTRKKAYHIGEDQNLIMPSHQPQYYWMVINDSGKVTEVYVAGKPGG